METSTKQEFKFSQPLRLIATVGNEVVYFRIYPFDPPLRNEVIQFGKLARLEATFKKKFGMMKIYEENLQRDEPYILVDMFMVEPKIVKKPPWEEG